MTIHTHTTNLSVPAVIKRAHRAFKGVLAGFSWRLWVYHGAYGADGFIMDGYTHMHVIGSSIKGN